MLPSHPAWGRGVYRGGRWWVTRGSYSLFPASFAAKIHHFFSVFPVETSSILTITTVPWVCARLFAGMRRWLRGESRAGTATNDLLFPSGKAERRSAWRWRGGGVSLTAGEQGQVAVAVQGERSGQDVPTSWQKGRLAVSTLGLCQANQRMAEPPPRGAQGARQELQIHLWSQGGMAELSCVGPTALLDAETPEFSSAPAIGCLPSKVSGDGSWSSHG